MRLSNKALAAASGLLWGGAVLVVGLVHLADPVYGTSFLRDLASVYPGFHEPRSILDVAVGTAFGAADGAIAGWLLAWLYNTVAGRPTQA